MQFLDVYCIYVDGVLSAYRYIKYIQYRNRTAHFYSLILIYVISIDEESFKDRSKLNYNNTSSAYKMLITSILY
jgi:hypothetical protein